MSVLPDMRHGNITVIGDVMLDRFWSGASRRVSPEAPVPVVNVSGQEDRAGGAGNVAVNLAELGVTVSLVGLCGDDEHARALRSCVESSGVRWNVMPCKADTIVKLRVLSRNQQLLRMDFEQSLAPHANDLFLRYAQQHLADADLVILSDYAKGTLELVQPLLAYCREAGKRTLVDPKGADFERYRGATLMTPNLSELEAVVGPCDTDEALVEKAGNLRAALELDAILVTRSEAGMTLIERDGSAQHLTASAQEVFDVTGAGDTVIAVMAGGLSAGLSMADAARYANHAAGVVVAKLGTASVTPEELEHAISDRDLDSFDRRPSEDEVLSRLARCRAARQRIVMTNGCFDLLHPGHIRYLQQSAKLGDLLLVAVNDDDSVRRLKGAGRPVNTVEDRMAVLAALEAVDFVLPFSEDTPERLIDLVGPDTLVKGGDYTVEQIAGHKSVLARGGDVVILDFVPGHSTTEMIERISD